MCLNLLFHKTKQKMDRKCMCLVLNTSWERWWNLIIFFWVRISSYTRNTKRWCQPSVPLVSNPSMWVLFLISLPPALGSSLHEERNETRLPMPHLLLYLLCSTCVLRTPPVISLQEQKGQEQIRWETSKFGISSACDERFVVRDPNGTLH